ncbi:MAG: hypothetical protein ACOCWQ_01260 [Nanoarchaeota archaeon]
MAFRPFGFLDYFLQEKPIKIRNPSVLVIQPLPRNTQITFRVFVRGAHKGREELVQVAEALLVFYRQFDKKGHMEAPDGMEQYFRCSWRWRHVKWSKALDETSRELVMGKLFDRIAAEGRTRGINGVWFLFATDNREDLFTILHKKQKRFPLVDKRGVFHVHPLH